MRNTHAANQIKKKKKKTGPTSPQVYPDIVRSRCTAVELGEVGRFRTFTRTAVADKHTHGHTHLRMILTVSVFPAPDSPETTIDWFVPVRPPARRICRYDS